MAQSEKGFLKYPVTYCINCYAVTNNELNTSGQLNTRTWKQHSITYNIIIATIQQCWNAVHYMELNMTFILKYFETDNFINRSKTPD